jgi:Flp pilus assembly protein TadD
MSAHSTELAPQDHRVWGNLADALWQIDGSREEARSDYRRAAALAQRGLEVNPKDGFSWMELAFYSARAGDGAHVEDYARRALQLDPEDPYVSYYGALVALERGDTEGALTSLARAVELGYAPQLIRAAPDFTSLRNDARFRKLLSQSDHAPQA